MIERLSYAAGTGASAALLAAWILFAAGAAGAAGTEVDWPCVQRLVPQVSAGMVWAGPPLDEVSDWRSDAEIEELATELADRRVPLEEAQSRVETFAEGLGDDKDRRLTMLFTGILDRVNAERNTVINGIKRYAHRQQELASRIESTLAELDDLPDNGTPEQEARRRELSERNIWDTRIYEERERSLSYICETPVMLEQRVFALGRTIQNFLE